MRLVQRGDPSRGTEIVYDRRRKRAYHPTCEASGVDYTIFASGDVSYRNRNGRCGRTAALLRLLLRLISFSTQLPAQGR